MRLIFEQIRTGGDRNFAYLLGDRDAGRAVVIDPSYAPDAIVERAREQRLTIDYVINTHGHADHVNGNERTVQLTGAPVAGHAALAAKDVTLTDGQELSVGALRLRFIDTPGHAADHLVVFESTCQLLITGDLLFIGKIGGTGSDAEARTEWNSLQRLLDAVPDSATVWPGHDYGVRPSSTIALERQTNPFLLCPDADALVRLKADWPRFKKEHGLK